MSPHERRIRRGAYLLPSLFTLGNIVLGFLAILLGLDGNFRRAAFLLVIAGILDALDGRIARLTQTESDFGKEFDSLADVLTFGSAPALLGYLWYPGEEFGRLGWLIPLFFLVATATRLARFNVQTKSVDSRFFVGLPAPAAAGTFCCFLIVFPEPTIWLATARLVLLVYLGIAMVTTFRFPSFKGFSVRRRWSYRSAVAMAAIFLLAISRPVIFLVASAIVYNLVGPFLWLRGRFVARSLPEEARGDEATGAPSEDGDCSS